MPNWNQVLVEIQKLQRPDALDCIRRRYLTQLHRHTGRNIITYYSGWLQKPGFPSSLTDADKNGFMTTIHNLDRSKGLDLFLHTPGGSTAATESIVDYLLRMFGKDIRAIIPQLAMSAGTMVACAGREIIMGQQSNLGPIDPQFNDVSAHGVLQEFQQAKREIKADPMTIPLWQPIVAKYRAAFLGDCDKAMKWSKDIVSRWLKDNMFFGDDEAEAKVNKIVENLSSHEEHKSHDRHISISDCQEMGLKITELEGLGSKMQDLVLTVHHAYMHTFSQTTATKIIENHKGVAMVQLMAMPPKN